MPATAWAACRNTICAEPPISVQQASCHNNSRRPSLHFCDRPSLCSAIAAWTGLSNQVRSRYCQLALPDCRVAIHLQQPLLRACSAQLPRGSTSAPCRTQARLHIRLMKLSLQDDHHHMKLSCSLLRAVYVCVCSSWAAVKRLLSLATRARLVGLARTTQTGATGSSQAVQLDTRGRRLVTRAEPWATMLSWPASSTQIRRQPLSGRQDAATASRLRRAPSGSAWATAAPTWSAAPAPICAGWRAASTARMCSRRPLQVQSGIP